MKNKNETWVLVSKSGWILCYREPNETPQIGCEIPPYVLRSKYSAKANPSNVIKKHTKGELIGTGIMEMWNKYSAFDKMKVEPQKFVIS